MNFKQREFWVVLVGLVLLIPLAMASGDSGDQQGYPVEFSGYVQSVNGTIIVVNDLVVDISGAPLATPLQPGSNIAIRGLLMPDGRIAATSIVVITGAIVTATPRPAPTATPQPGAQGECPYTQSYWRGNAPVWPVESLMLGTQSYSAAELRTLLDSDVQGDASLRLARQLISAKLNVANGSDPQPIGNVILQADLLLSQFPNKLPYGVLPTADVGPAMVTNAELLDSYNNNLVTPYCVRSQPVVDDDDGDDNDNANIVVIEGPIQSITGNIIRIYNFNVVVDPGNPILATLRAGDVIRIEGVLDSQNDVLIIVATVIVIVDADRDEGDEPSAPDWEDDGSCANPPPAHAPARGWRHRCEGAPHPSSQGMGNNGMGNSGMGMGMGMGNK